MAKAAKRKSGRRKSRRPNWLILGALAALVLGFLARRSMLPQMLYSMSHRAPDHAAQSAPNPQSENISDSDRSALTNAIKHGAN